MMNKSHHGKAAKTADTTSHNTVKCYPSFRVMMLRTLVPKQDVLTSEAKWDDFDDCTSSRYNASNSAFILLLVQGGTLGICRFQVGLQHSELLVSLEYPYCI